MLRNIVTWAAIIVLVFVATWYFFYKKYDYSISFNTKETPGEVYQQLLYYQYDFLQDAQYTDKTPFYQLTQKVKIDRHDLLLTWNLEKLNDTLSRVAASINHLENSAFYRLKLLFGQGSIKNIIKEEVKGFQAALQEEAALYDINIVGIQTSPATTCACIHLENEVKNKAIDMMKNISHLSRYIQENQLDMEARPRVNVLKWDVERNRIEYEFCFPIDPDKLPGETEKIYLKQIPARESLMATYNGNYMFSHLAWVKLLDYAETMEIKVLKQPLEVFNDNPELGGDARQWQAEIYLPLKPL